MAVPQLSPTAMLPCRRRLTRAQIGTSNKRLTFRQAAPHKPRSLMDLPRELRDEIVWLAIQDDIDPTEYTELVSRPGPTITALTRVSRSVRVEAADIYWSRTKFTYSTHDLAQVDAAAPDWSRKQLNYKPHKSLRDETLSDHRGGYKLTSWLSTWGRLVVPRVSRLKLLLSFRAGGLDIQLGKHANPRIHAWTHNDSGAEDYVKTFVTAELFPNRHSMITPERFGKVCETLCEVGRMIPAPERRASKLYIGGLAWHTNDETLREYYRRW